MIQYLYVILVIGILVGSVYAILGTLEDRLLLHPLPCTYYTGYDDATTELVWLPSGGLVLHCRQRQSNADATKSFDIAHGITNNQVDGFANSGGGIGSNRVDGINLANDGGSGIAGDIGNRAIICLHGNGGNADGMANMSRLLLERGYDVYVLEYAGYGMAAYPREPSSGNGADRKGVHPTTKSLDRKRVHPTTKSLIHWCYRGRVKETKSTRTSYGASSAIVINW